MSETIAAGSASVYSRGSGSYDPHGQHQAGRPFTVLGRQFNRSPKVLSRNYAVYIFALRALPRSKGGLFAAPNGNTVQNIVRHLCLFLTKPEYIDYYWNPYHNWCEQKRNEPGKVLLSSNGNKKADNTNNKEW